MRGGAGAGDAADRDALALEHLEDADMSGASRTAAAEHQADTAGSLDAAGQHDCEKKDQDCRGRMSGTHQDYSDSRLGRSLRAGGGS